jgi:hypothetical protein
MKINFDLSIRDLAGDPIQTKEKDGTERDFTLRDVCVNAILAEPQDRNAKPLDGKEKVRRLRLADKIYGCKEPINLPAEDVATLKEQIAALYPIVTTGRAWAILEGEDTPIGTPTTDPPAAE